MNKLKNISLIAASAILAASLVGCASSTDTAESIVKKTEALENYTGTVIISTDLSYQDEESNFKMESTLYYNEDPFFAHTSIKTSTQERENAENSYTSDMYLQTVDGVNTVYAGYNGEWYKQEIDSENFAYSVSQYNPVENGLLFIKAASGLQNMGSEQYNGMDVDRFEGTIPADMLADVMESSGAIGLVGTGIDSSYFSDAQPQAISIYVNEEGVIVGYSMDLTDLVSSLFTALYEANGIAEEDQLLTVNKYICEGTVTEYNQGIDSTLPDEALNATELTAVSDTTESLDNNEDTNTSDSSANE